MTDSNHLKTPQKHQEYSFIHTLVKSCFIIHTNEITINSIQHTATVTTYAGKRVNFNFPEEVSRRFLYFACDCFATCKIFPALAVPLRDNLSLLDVLATQKLAS